MHALVASGRDASVSMADVPEPAPLPFQAVVEVAASSVNRGEVRRLAAQPAGFVSGWDVAGTVVRAAADGSGPTEGARVVGLVPCGAWAERVEIHTNMLHELPPDVGFTAAAALPIAGLTALRALLAGGALLGRRVLVTGAAGGVGRFAVQLASLGGAHVTGIARDAGRADGLHALGAHAVIESPDELDGDFDVILESAGGPSLAAALRHIAPNGTVVTFGDSSGEAVEFRAAEFYRPAAGARVFALMVFPELMREMSTARDLRTLVDFVAAGRLDPQVAGVVPWTDAKRAFDRLLRREVPGKLVLNLKENRS